MAKATTPRKRNPQDATRRNVQASAKRDAALDARVDKLEAYVALAFSLISLLAVATLSDEKAAEVAQQIEDAKK